MATLNGVNLPASGTTLFLSLLGEAAAANPGLAPLVAGLDRSNLLGERLVRFEAARHNLPVEERLDVAEFLTRRVAESLVYETESGSKIPLAEYMQGRANPLELITKAIPGGVQDIRRMTLRGHIYEASRLSDVASMLDGESKCTPAASDILERISRGDRIELTNRKFVMLGGAAALGPTELLLRAGATVLYIDLKPGPQFIAEANIQGGVLVYPKANANLATQPLEIAATIEAFAQGSPVHIGCFAYLDRDALDLRLAAAMNAIVRKVDPAIIGSVGLYISPTSPVPSAKEDYVTATGAYANASASTRVWKAVLPKIPKVGRPLMQNHYVLNDTYWPRNVVAIQGASYQMAQYIEKSLASEVYATRGTRPGEANPLFISANVSPITQTPSIREVFGPGLKGAPMIGLEAYAPETTRWLSGLIYIQQILENERNPFEDGNEKLRRLRRLREVQVHGGLYSHAHAIEGAILQATLKGAASGRKEFESFLKMFKSKKKK